MMPQPTARCGPRMRTSKSPGTVDELDPPARSRQSYGVIEERNPAKIFRKHRYKPPLIACHIRGSPHNVRRKLITVHRYRRCRAKRPHFS